MLSVSEEDATGTTASAAVLSSETTSGGPCGCSPCGRRTLRAPELRGLPVDGLDLVLRQLAVAGPQHERDHALVVGQLLGELDGQGAVGALRERVGGPGVVRALGDEADREDGEQEGHEGDEPGRTPAGDETGGGGGLVTGHGGSLRSGR